MSFTADDMKAKLADYYGDSTGHLADLWKQFTDDVDFAFTVGEEKAWYDAALATLSVTPAGTFLPDLANTFWSQADPLNDLLGGGFTTPADLDLVAWYDFSDTATITDAAGEISSVADKSGNGYTLTSSGTNHPFTGTRTQNSLNVIDFPDTSLIYLRNISVPLVQPLTIAVVFANDDVSATRRYVSGLGGTWGLLTLVGGSPRIASASNSLTGQAVFANGTAYIWDAYFNDANTNISTINGSSSAPVASGVVDNTGLAVGAGGGEIEFDGWVGEVIVWNGNANAAAVRTYLNDKWAVHA
jgi:hypothetical protein